MIRRDALYSSYALALLLAGASIGQAHGTPSPSDERFDGSLYVRIVSAINGQVLTNTRDGRLVLAPPVPPPRYGVADNYTQLFTIGRDGAGARRGLRQRRSGVRSDDVHQARQQFGQLRDTEPALVPGRERGRSTTRAHRGTGVRDHP